MLLIRRQPMEVFAEAARRHFEGQMCEHLMRFAPVHCPTLGETVVRDLVRLGIARAEEYGLTTRGAVRLFVELMIQLGTDFDSDPQLAWASSTLQAPEPATQEERATLLYARALNYLDAVVGPRYEYEKQALGRAERLTVQDLSQWASDSREAMLASLRALYPQKFHYAGAQAVQEILNEGAAQARRRGIADPRGAVLFAVLMYAFGHHCLTDPQFPWLTAILTDATSQDERRTMIEALFARSLGYVRKSLSVLAGRE